MDTTKLCDAVIAVLKEDPVVELLGALHTNRCIDRLVAADVKVVDELFKEKPA